MLCMCIKLSDLLSHLRINNLSTFKADQCSDRLSDFAFFCYNVITLHISVTSYLREVHSDKTDHINKPLSICVSFIYVSELYC